MLESRVESGCSSEVEVYLDLDNGPRIRVAQVGSDSLIVRDDGGQALADRPAILLIVVDLQVDVYLLWLTNHDKAKGIVHFVPG